MRRSADRVSALVERVPLVSALRARAAAATGIWILLTCALAWSLDDRVYRFQVATGVDPRPLALVELTVVIGACCVPAIAAPQLWSWERTGTRRTPHLVSAAFAPSMIVVLASTPKFLQLAGADVAVIPTTAFVNVITFSGVATVAAIWLGRRLGPILGVVGYVGGVGLQALEIAWPIPVDGHETSTASFIMGFATLVVAPAGLAVTLGRSGRSLDL